MSAPALDRPHRAVVLRTGPLSARTRLRPLVVAAGCALVVLVAVVLGISLGDYTMDPRTVLEALLGGGDPGSAFVVLELRLPRTCTGLLAGAALGVSGALFQAVTRNPLASPDVLGISQGAALAAVATIVLGGSGPAAAGPAGLPLAAASLAGGLAAAALLLALGARGDLEGPRLVLVGVGLATVLTAGTSWLLLRGGRTDALQAVAWLSGSLDGRGWADVAPLAWGAALLLPALGVLQHRLRTAELGPDTARALGARTGRVRTGALLVAVLLASLATSAAGPVAFAALVAPHLAARLGRPAGTSLLLSALAGAALVLVADLVGHLACSAICPSAS